MIVRLERSFPDTQRCFFREVPEYSRILGQFPDHRLIHSRFNTLHVGTDSRMFGNILDYCRCCGKSVWEIPMKGQATSVSSNARRKDRKISRGGLACWSFISSIKPERLPYSLMSLFPMSYGATKRRGCISVWSGFNRYIGKCRAPTVFNPFNGAT